MRRSTWLAVVLVLLMAPAMASAAPAGNNACAAPFMTSAAGPAASTPAKLDVIFTEATDYSCCGPALDNCDWYCQGNIYLFSCQGDACGPGCCQYYCQCEIWP